MKKCIEQIYNLSLIVCSLMEKVINEGFINKNNL